MPKGNKKKILPEAERKSNWERHWDVPEKSVDLGRQKWRGRTFPYRMNKDGNRSIRRENEGPIWSENVWSWIAIGLKGLQCQAEEFAFYPAATGSYSGLLSKGLACSALSYRRLYWWHCAEKFDGEEMKHIPWLRARSAVMRWRVPVWAGQVELVTELGGVHRTW